MVKEGDLLGVAEIAAMFEVETNTAWRWSQRDDFPEPVARLASGPVWRRRDLERWKRPQPGRPPSKS
jgi:predicted DNA-binding transcriptional regulator AlpA